MNPRSTLFLFLMAAALSAYVFLSERSGSGTRSVRTTDGDTVSFPSLPVPRFTAIELMQSNSLLRVERTNDTWVLRRPVTYPAQLASIERLLEQLGRLTPSSYVSAAQVAGQPDALRSFGLDPARATLTLTGGDQPVILRIGGAAPAAGLVYLQLVGTDGVFLADAKLLEALPETPDDWRDRALLDLGGRPYDRVTLAAAGRTVFDAVKDATGRWQLRQPMSARADGERLEALVAELQQVRVAGFVSDSAVVDRSALGLQPPAAELTIGRGTNELTRLELGGTPTNAPGYRFVRRLRHTNIVQVPAAPLALLERPLNEYRDPYLIGPLSGVTRIERAGTGGFVLERQGTNWNVTAPRRFAADSPTVGLLLDQLAGLEIVQFVNDVVTDLKPYGLHAPIREFVLGRGTNELVRVQLGSAANTNGTLMFARRTDEPGVYAVPRTVLLNLESAGQLRDWQFTATNVVAVDIVQQGRSRRLVRQGADWQVASGAAGTLVSDSVEETLYRLGRWESSRYAITDETAILKAGRFAETSHEVTLTFRAGAGLRTLNLRFGGILAANRLVLARFDDDPTALRLELPGQLYLDVLRDFGAP